MDDGRNVAGSDELQPRRRHHHYRLRSYGDGRPDNDRTREADELADFEARLREEVDAQGRFLRQYVDGSPAVHRWAIPSLRRGSCVRRCASMRRH